MRQKYFLDVLSQPKKDGNERFYLALLLRPCRDPVGEHLQVLIEIEESHLAKKSIV